ncbi:hypothetical protein PHYSODRAFT_511565, partial [Phytophthora sojae]
SFQNQELPDVKELFREELRMNMSTTDIDARVIEYFHLCNSLIKNMLQAHREFAAERTEEQGGQSGRAAAKGAPKERCFHSGGPHYLSKCPMVTPAERDKLLADHKQDSKGDSTDKGRHH